MPDKRWHPAYGHPGHPGAGEVPPPGGPPSPSLAWCEVAWLDPEDWEAIDRLLAAPVPEPEVSSSPDRGALAAALERFKDRAAAAFVPADRLANDLLDLWAAARPFGAGAAHPAEELLSTLGCRHLVRGEEIMSVWRRTSDAVGGA